MLCATGRIAERRRHSAARGTAGASGVRMAREPEFARADLDRAHDAMRRALIGRWEADTWTFPLQEAGRRSYTFHFACRSPGIRLELKYALWRKFDAGEWDATGNHRNESLALTRLGAWLDKEAPAARSLLDRPPHDWEVALRAHLAGEGRLSADVRQVLMADQRYRAYPEEDRRIRLLRQIRAMVLSACDTRPELEKDVWDLAALGVPQHPLTGTRRLDFAAIPQPWLRALAQRYLARTLPGVSAADCQSRLRAIGRFADFLGRAAPGDAVPALDRPLILAYLADLERQELSVDAHYRAVQLVRHFLETSAYELEAVGLPRERLIFDRDFPARPTLPDEILPAAVLARVWAELPHLAEPARLQVGLLLACGLLVGELCTLGIDCLTDAPDGTPWLRMAEGGARERAVPLVDPGLAAAVRAQRAIVREKWGERATYLFPSARSPDKPYRYTVFRQVLNAWAVRREIRDETGAIFRFRSRQFRHTVGRELAGEAVPLEVLADLFGHRGLAMVRRYRRPGADRLRAELERARRDAP